MNFYPFHIGDYAKDTAHLSMTEDGAYRRLIDLYYTRERPLPADVQTIYRLARAHTKLERAAIDTVLEEFFVRKEIGFLHNRCEKEIENAQARISAAQKNGQRGGRPKKQGVPGDQQQEEKNPLGSEKKPTGLFVGCENETHEKAHQSQSHKPITNNQEPKNKERVRADVLQPEGVTDSVWSDFLSIRKAKRAPITETALTQLATEADKAGLSLNDALAMCCARGWQGFKAEWVQDRQQAPQRPASRADMIAGAAAAIFEDATHV